MFGVVKALGEAHVSIADQVYEQVRTLPDQLAREVLDFVVYLRERRDRAGWRDMMDAQSASLAPVWNAPEDEVWDDA
jgi:hypothetical protein